MGSSDYMDFKNDYTETSGFYQESQKNELTSKINYNKLCEKFNSVQCIYQP